MVFPDHSHFLTLILLLSSCSALSPKLSNYSVSRSDMSITHIKKQRFKRKSSNCNNKNKINIIYFRDLEKTTSKKERTSDDKRPLISPFYRYLRVQEDKFE